jgi:phosphatidylserine decarboxylase
MSLKIYLSGIILSLCTLIPLGMKWEIKKKVTIPSAFIIGALSGTIVHGIHLFIELRYYQIILIEIVLIGVIAVSMLLWRFFRDPERVPPGSENVILSPADGRIIYMKKIEENEIPFSEKKGKKFNLVDFIQSNIEIDNGYLIGIAMNYLDVHVNRAPIGGKITLLKHIKGLFISLKKKEAVIQNERVLTVIDNGHFKIGIVQIASRLVRKIIPYITEGGEIQIGERMGMIRFGSQVDMIIPDLPSLCLNVKINEEVKACTTIIASFNK